MPFPLVPPSKNRHLITLLRQRIAIAPGRALVTQGMVVPPRCLVAGVPGKVRRELSDAEVAANRHNAAVYERLIDLHRGAQQA